MFTGWAGGISFKKRYKGNTQIKQGNRSNPLGAGLNLSRTLGRACYTRTQASPRQDSPLCPEPITSCASVRDPSPEVAKHLARCWLEETEKNLLQLMYRLSLLYPAIESNNSAVDTWTVAN